MKQILVDLWESRNPTIKIFNGTKKDIILKCVDDNYDNIFFCINKKIIYILDRDYNLYVNYQY